MKYTFKQQQQSSLIQVKLAVRTYQNHSQIHK